MPNLPIYSKNLGVDGFSPAGRTGEKRLDREKLRKTCGDFESVLISQMLKSMRQTMTASGFTGNGLGKGVYEPLFDQEVGRLLAKRGGLGIGKIIYDRVIQREERQGTIPPESKTGEADRTKKNSPSPLEKGRFHAIYGR